MLYSNIIGTSNNILVNKPKIELIYTSLNLFNDCNVELVIINRLPINDTNTAIDRIR